MIQHNPAKNYQHFFSLKIDKLILKFIWTRKGVRVANIILKKSQFGGLKLPYIKTSHKGAVIKTVCSTEKMDIQTKGAERSPGRNGHVYGQLLFYKGTQVTQGEHTVFSTKGAETLGHLFIQGQKLSSWCPSLQGVPSSSLYPQSSRAVLPKQHSPLFVSHTSFSRDCPQEELPTP